METTLVPNSEHYRLLWHKDGQEERGEVLLEDYATREK